MNMTVDFLMGFHMWVNKFFVPWIHIRETSPENSRICPDLSNTIKTLFLVMLGWMNRLEKS